MRAASRNKRVLAHALFAFAGQSDMLWRKPIFKDKPEDITLVLTMCTRRAEVGVMARGMGMAGGATS
eukprot:scaffold52029_cov39-Tisochrysis_lutea.AAC.3